jgi:SAM-dependent methyltransferase
MRKYKIHHPLDSPERTLYHKQIIQQKKILRRLYLKWYGIFTDEVKKLPDGVIVELGSGGGFLKEIEPSVICSDIIDMPHNDMTFSALNMPFEANTLSGIFMIDTFHHIPDSEQFLHEAYRVLKQGGKMVMIEPANTHWGRFIFKNFHHEPFNTNGSWTIPSTGPLTGANGALPWIVFERDKADFTKKFSGFKIESIKFINPLIYLISGGVSRKQLLPDLFIPCIEWIDSFLPKINKHLSMFMVITIQKH